jgi:phage/plasmid primase-like uncharacterized protein
MNPKALASSSSPQNATGSSWSAEIYDFPLAIAIDSQAAAAQSHPLPPRALTRFARGVSNSGCALQLGVVDDCTWLLLACVGYPNARVIRAATNRQAPVYAVGHARDLALVAQRLRAVHPRARLLICANDEDRRIARHVAEDTPRCEFTWPVFVAAGRGAGENSFSDLRQREGLSTVARQLQSVITVLRGRAASAR